MKNCLITGISGGIGSTLAYFLFKKGFNVIGVDNFANGYAQNLDQYEDFNSTVYKEDILNTKAIQNIINHHKIDVIIHLAAITSLPTCEEDSQNCFKVNTLGTISVLEASRLTNVKKVIFASTSAIYENIESKIPFTENLTTTPTLSYPLSKKMAEDICNSYKVKYDMEIPILRLFNVFGPRQDFYRKSPPLINYIVKEIINHRQPVLHSSGEQSRDYIHVNDVCESILAAIYKGNETYNVCSGRLISVNKIYQIVSESLNFPYPSKRRNSENLWDSYKIDINKELIKKETNKFALGDNSKIQRELKVKINTNIEELIKETALEIKKIYGKK